MTIGELKGRQGDLNGAIEQYMEAKRVCTVTGTLETANAKIVLQRIEDLQSALAQGNNPLNLHQARPPRTHNFRHF